MSRQISLGLLALLLAGSGLWINHMRVAAKGSSLLAKLDQIVNVSSEPVLDCTKIAAKHPIVILALGQSNAANHGEVAMATRAPTVLVVDKKCIMATDPLPGSTGNGGSIWSRLPNYLPTHDPQRLLVLSVMGIDATSIADWTSDPSPLRERLTDRIKLMKTFGLLPQVILWQQGEADARLGTTSEAYGIGLDKLADTLTQAGSDAPVVMALSTVCSSLPNGNIRTAITVKAIQNGRFKVGPDTDTLNDAGSRLDGCHFSTEGLDQAARLWASELQFVFASI